MSQINERDNGENGGICAACVRTMIIASVISGFLLGAGPFLSLFLVPLQFVLLRRGQKPFLAAIAASLAIGGVIWLLSGPESGEAVQIVSALGMAAALVMLNWNETLPFAKLAPWIRLSAAGAIASLVMMLNLQSAAGMGYWSDVALLIREIPAFAEIFGVFVPGLEESEIIAFLQGFIFRSILFSETIKILLVYGFGRALARGVSNIVPALSRFSLPNYLVWSVIASAAGMMISERLSWLIPAYLFWNLFLLTLLIYGLLGLAIVARFSLKRPVLKAMLPGLLIVSVLVMGWNIILAVSLAILGISSLWIRYSDGTGAAVDGDSGSAGDS